MGDLIYRDTLISEIESMPFNSTINHNLAIGIVVNAPTVDAEPVRHGHWVEKSDFDYDNYYECSVCREP